MALSLGVARRPGLCGVRSIGKAHMRNRANCIVFGKEPLSSEGIATGQVSHILDAMSSE